uniref:hypothetical protein n=1 Tax=Parerythrobacter lutipelagi TaxID=1964208 RepID=UPI0010F6F18A|nr:hypothetical protein [Parerythrobacter lutipelagi]
MFIGHWAPALAAAAVSKDAPKLSTLFIGAQLVDWGFMAFGLVGLEKVRIEPGFTALSPLDLYHMPFTHSLVGTLVWALVFAFIIMVGRRNAGAAILAGLVVLSHWVLDWLVHAPDLTLAGGENKFGLGLWDYPWIVIPLELVLVIGSFTYYMRRTKGPMGPAFVLLFVLLAMQAFSWFGPAPSPNPTIFFITGLVAFTIITLLAKWVGDTRWHKSQVGLAVPSAYR